MSGGGSSGVDPGAIVLSIITVIVILVLAWVLGRGADHTPANDHATVTEQTAQARSDDH